jgi:hypothetical protein
VLEPHNWRIVSSDLAAGKISKACTNPTYTKQGKKYTAFRPMGHEIFHANEYSRMDLSEKNAYLKQYPEVLG